MRTWMFAVIAIVFGLSFAKAGDVATQTETAAVSSAERVDKLLQEKDIPLNLELKKKASDDGFSVGRFLMAISVLGITGIGAYAFAKKYIAKGQEKNSQTEIKVLTQHYLGPKKSLAIIRVAGESMLIGVTENNINMIKSLALLDDEIPEVTPTNFENVFAAKQNGDEEEAFSITGIKDVVKTRLKNMRSL